MANNKTIAFKVELQGTTAQKKKLAELETEVKKLTNKRTELNKAVKAGTKTTKEYGVEIAKINTGLKAHRRQLLVTRQEMLNIDGFTTRLGKSFRKMGTSIVAGFAGLFAIQKISQLFVSSAKVLKDFEQQMARVKAITGATNEEFNRLQNSAKELGATTQFTASEVGKLQEEYAKLGFTTEQILDASEATLQLATATGSDLAQSAKVAAATINGFGLQAKDTQRIVDVMAKSFTSSALDLSKFETAMATVAPVASAVGMSIEETTASLGVLVDAGFDASTAGTALRNILLDTEKAGISTSIAFERIKSSADPTTTALDLFGKRGAAVAIALANSTDKTNEFTKSLKNSRGAAEAMAKIVGDTLEGDIKRFNSAWEGLVLNLGDGANDLFRNVVEGATDFISTLSDLTKNTHAESEALEQQRIKVNVLVSRIANLNEGTDERRRLIEELNIISPKFLDGLDRENLSNDVLAKRLKEVNKQLVNQILIKREDEKLAEQAEEQADAQTKAIEAEINLSEQLLKIREAGFKGISKEIDLNKTAIQQANELLDILKEQAVRSRVTTSFGGVVESSNEQAKAYDRLSGALTRNSIAQVELNEENSKAVEISQKKDALLKKLGISEDKQSKSIDKTAKSLNNQAIAAKAVKFELEELEEVADDDFFDDEYEQQVVNSTNALITMYDTVMSKEQELQDIQSKRMDAVNEQLVNKSQEQLDAERELRETIAKGSIDLAQQTANALLDVSSRKAERERDIELTNLDAKLRNGLISQEDFEKKKLEIEKKAFERKKRIEIANIAISLATEIASIAANSAGNPLNAFTFGAAGAAQNIALAGIATARSAIQAGVVASQKFAEGGYTGSGFGSPDSSGFKQAGVVHEGEYVVPKNVLESQRGSSLVGALEAMRTNRPQPFSNFGFANGGFAGSSSVDMVDLENKISKAVANSVGAIQVVNNATDTISQAARVNNIQSEATFG